MATALLGHHPQERRLADGAAVVGDDDTLVGVEELPAEAPAVPHPGEDGKVDLPRLHRPHRPGAEHRGAVRGGAGMARCIRTKPSRSPAVIASIEPAGALERASAHVGAGVIAPASSGTCPVAARCRIASYGLGLTLVKTERLRDPLDEELVERLSPEHLHEATEDDEGGVVVGERVARSEELGQLAQRGDVPLECVVAAAGVGEDVALEAGGVREQVPGREDLRGLRVADDQLGEVVEERLVEVEEAVVDELHHQRRGPDLGDGADLEHGVGVDLDVRPEAGHATGRGDDPPARRGRPRSLRGRRARRRGRRRCPRASGRWPVRSSPTCGQP